MPTKKEIFINSAKLIDIDGRTNIPTILLYEGNKHFVGYEALERCNSPHLLNEDFKIELGKEDPTRKRFETAAGHLRSAAGLAKDFIDSTIESSKHWFSERGLCLPIKILIAEPLAMGKAQQVDDSWLANYRAALRRVLARRFEEIDFLPEPFAVFQYYRYGVRHALVAQRIKHVALVLDFGGGTFDVSVIETSAQGDISRSGRNSRPLSAASIPVGGFYINRIIARRLLEKTASKGISKSDIDKAFKKFEELKNADASELTSLRSDLINFIRAMKKMLFSIESAKLAICNSIANWGLDADLSQGPGYRVGVARNPLCADSEWVEMRIDADLLRDIFERQVWAQKLKPTIADAIQRARSELAGQTISIVLLSGGSSNIRWLKPLIERDLKSLISDAEIIELSENFQEIVAKGLAIECARRFYTEGSGDFRAVTYNRLCLALRANDGDLEVRRYRPVSEGLPTMNDIGVLLPSASVLGGLIEKAFRWKVSLSKPPSRLLSYYFMRSSFDPEDIQSLHNLDNRIATPPRTTFGASIEIELTIREDGTTTPRFIYGHGHRAKDIMIVEGKPFYLDMTFGLKNAPAATYLGFDFGTSNSALSLVEEADVKVYSDRARDKRWLELNDLVSVLPYPVAAPLAAYMAETSGRMEHCAREAVEAFLALAAYLSYNEYCCGNKRAITRIFKSMPHRSAGPLWSLLKQSVSALGERSVFSRKYSQLVQDPLFTEIDVSIRNLSFAKHGKIAEVDYPRLVTILGNVTSQVFQSKLFGFFEDVKKKQFQNVFAGVFRNAIGPSQVFTDIYKYEGDQTFSSEQVFVVDVDRSEGLPMSPLMLWGLSTKEEHV